MKFLNDCINPGGRSWQNTPRNNSCCVLSLDQAYILIHAIRQRASHGRHFVFRDFLSLVRSLAMCKSGVMFCGDCALNKLSVSTHETLDAFTFQSLKTNVLLRKCILLVLRRASAIERDFKNSASTLDDQNNRVLHWEDFLSMCERNGITKAHGHQACATCLRSVVIR